MNITVVEPMVESHGRNFFISTSKVRERRWISLILDITTETRPPSCYLAFDVCRLTLPAQIYL